MSSTRRRPLEVADTEGVEFEFTHLLDPLPAPTGPAVVPPPPVLTPPAPLPTLAPPASPLALLTPAAPAPADAPRDEPELSLPALLASLIAGAAPASPPPGAAPTAVAPVEPVAPGSRFAEPRLSDDLLPVRRRRR